MPRTFTIILLISLWLAGCGNAQTPTAGQIPSITPSLIPPPTSFPTSTPVPTPIPGTLYVDPSLSLGPISPLIFGSNYGPWLTVPFYNLQQAYDSGIKILRFPAGPGAIIMTLLLSRSINSWILRTEWGLLPSFMSACWMELQSKPQRWSAIPTWKESITFNTGRSGMNQPYSMPK